MSIHKKLAEIQGKLKVPKGQYNAFGKYYYRNCEDILEAVKPMLKELNCTLTIYDEIVNMGDRYYVKANVLLLDFDAADEGHLCKVISQAFAREEENKKGMDGSQITGAASSYARKYALNGLFCLDDTKDADSNEKPNDQTDNNNQVQNIENPKTKLFNEIVALAGEIGETKVNVVSQIKERFNKASGTEVTLPELEELLKYYVDRVKGVNADA